jgi:hypothetical protein
MLNYRFAIGALFLVASLHPAWGLSCASYPYTLANGTTADATQVMANFSTIQSCANNLAASILYESQLHGVTSSNAPATSGSTDPGMIARIYATNVGSNGYGLDFGTGNLNGYSWIQSRKSNDFTVNVPLLLNPNGGSVGIGTMTPSYSLYVNGTAYAAGAAGALSDRRHKQDIEALPDGALALVQALKPVHFYWKSPTDDGMRGEQIGFVAQDVESVIPDAVLTAHDAQKTLGLKYDEFIPVLTKALQEQQKEIAALQNANREMAQRLQSLQRQLAATTSGDTQSADGLHKGNALRR